MNTHNRLKVIEGKIELLISTLPQKQQRRNHSISDADLVCLLRIAADELEGKAAAKKKETKAEAAYRSAYEKAQKRNLSSRLKS